MKMKLALLVAAACLGTAVAQETYSTWTYHKYVALDTRANALNVPAAVTGFPVLVRLDSVNFSAGFAQSIGRGRDIRFTRNGDLVRLPHQIDRWDSVGKKAEIWVRVDSIRGANLSSFRMHWGKAAVADSSKGSAVFDTTTGFQAVLHLGEATDSLARDATLNGYNGTPGNVGSVGNPQDTAGVIGQAKSFRGGSATAGGYYVLNGTAASKLNFPTGGPFTISAWVNAYNNTFSSHMISKDELQYSLAKRASGTMWEIKDYEEGTGARFIQNVAVVTNTWQHVVGVSEGATMALYVDGVSIATDPASDVSGGTTRVTTQDVNIGRDPNSAGTPLRYFPGAIDEVSLANRARSASWIKLSYETQKPGARSALTDTMPIPLAIARAGRSNASQMSLQVSGSRVTFQLPASEATLSLSVVDMRGKTIWSRQIGAANASQAFVWDGRNNSGTRVNSGLYIARIASLEGKNDVLVSQPFTYAP